MESYRGNGKKIRRGGIFPRNFMSCFLLLSILALNFGIDAKESDEFGLEFSKLDSEEFSPEMEVVRINESGILDGIKFESEEEPITPPQPTMGDVVTLLKNIQEEISAFRNKTDEHYVELKGQMLSLSNQQKNETKNQIPPSEQKKDNSKETGQKKGTVANKNSKVQTPPPSPVPTPAPAVVTSPPQFYRSSNFFGSSFTPSSSEWKTKCVDLPTGFSGMISSVKTGGNCLLVCPEKGCKADSFGRLIIVIKAECQKINVDTKEIGFGNKIKSFRRCY